VHVNAWLLHRLLFTRWCAGATTSRAIDVAGQEGVVRPEDHAGILCEIMAGLASRSLPAPADAERTIVERHMAPWISRFFANLEGARSAHFYRPMGAVGRIFVDIET